ncbi:Athe_2463 domain-containing protein [Vallitalea guaymasensis]|uniref:Athe_2463 domain-containing protein n=1 Tax=Vallitalea guaymasensis TaxID=1185412 RepID=UPI000DE3226E|nr:hypothetical protein [Vallitalea guaymasensis]
MKNTFRKIGLMIFIFSILFTSIRYKTFAITNNNQLSYEYMSGQIPFETLSLPPDYKNKPYIKINISGKETKLWFNTELWVDKNIGVYGHYGYVPDNDFKNYTENPDPSITTPYYTRYGIKGEYRYHGYTVDGIRHTNKSFPVDEASTRKAEQKTWQYHYWANPILAKKQDGEISGWNDEAISNNRQGIQEWINEGLPFEIKNGSNPSSQNAYDYANVLTPSTLYSYGEAKMWHKNRTGYWYQTFTLKKRTGRKQTPITLDINILDKGKYIINPGEDEVKVNVDVTITLQDEAYYNNVIEREIYYTRRDISHYNLQLNDTTYTFDGNSTTNTYKGTVSLDIPRSIISDDGNYTVSGIASVSYGNPQSDNAYDNDTDEVNKRKLDKFVIPFNKSDDLVCKFSVASVVNWNDTTPLKADNFKYQDLSVGNIKKYEFELTGEDGTKVVKEYNNSSIDNQTINNLLYDMAKDKNKEKYKIHVKQTVYDSNRIAEYDKNVYVMKAYTPQKTVEIDVELPRKVFDIEPYGATIGDMKAEDINLLKVTIDGTPINVSVNDFFNGGFTFGAIESNNNTEVHFIEVAATSSDDVESHVQKWVTVYNTKPKAQLTLQGTQKENRKFETLNTSDSANDPYLLQHYPTSYTYEITALNSSDMNKLNYERQGENHIFQSSKEGVYQISCTATNRSGRSSTYNLPLIVMKDHKPAMNFDIWNNYLARSEALSMEFGAESIDGDTIINKRIKILKDQDKDGTYEKEVLNTSLTDDFSYTPTELGHYRAIISAEESFGEETIIKWLDGTEKRTNEVIRDFFVENLRPLTEVHLDIPYNFPQVDVIISLDKNLTDSKKADIKSKRIDYNNYLRSQGINPIIEIWDMKCYEYSTPASTSRNTGSTYPQNSIPYSSSGYSGTLTQTNVVNNWYWHDFGYYTTEEECHTVTERYKYYHCDYYSYDELVEMYGAWDCGNFEFRTRTKNVCSSVDVWHSDNRKVNNYTGYYSGNIYKYVRQNPPVENFRSEADKYIIYVSENGINTTSPSEHKNRLTPIKEFEDLAKEHDFDVTLIGNSTIKSQYSLYNHYYSADDILDSINKALDDIIEDNPFSSDYLVELGSNVNIETVELETEGDELKENGFQYIHNPNYYDNSLGMFSYGKSEFNENEDWTTTKPTILDKTGRLDIYHRVKDSITGYEDNELYSNIFRTSINIHRKPIAQFNLDWIYNPATRVYETTWEDGSYDLDHQYNHPQKGIIERKIVYWDKTRPIEKYYKIPDNLKPGATYTVEYIVKDLENTWSLPCIKEFTLPTAPPPQILDAKLKTVLDKFNLNSIPASENLLAYDIKTRFPYSHHIEMAMYDGNTIKTPNKTITSYAIKNGQDYNWNDVTYNIPSTLPDGYYLFKLFAIDSNNSNNKRSKDFTVRVETPVDLEGTIEKDKITYDRETLIEASTSKYVNTVTITLFKDTMYERTRNLSCIKTEGDKKYWSLTYKEERRYIEDNFYTARFTARTPNNNQETQDNSFEFTHNTPPTVSIQSTEPSYIYEGDNIFANIIVNDIDLDTLTLDIDLYKNGNKLTSKRVIANPEGTTYDLIKQNLMNNIESGDYEIRVHVDDGNGGVANANMLFKVYELTIDGFVNHTPKWDENRIKYNRAMSKTDDDPRDSDTYWSGERFIVSADTTEIHADSNVVAGNVETEILDTAYDTNLESANKTNWHGELWDNSMINKWGNDAAIYITFRFTVNYSNGTVKTDDVKVKIDNIDSYYRYHRKW